MGWSTWRREWRSLEVLEGLEGVEGTVSREMVALRGGDAGDSISMSPPGVGEGVEEGVALVKAESETSAWVMGRVRAERLHLLLHG